MANEQTRPAAAGPEREWRTGTLVYRAGDLRRLFGWLLCGDFVWSLKDRSVLPVMQVLLARYHATAALTGFLIGSLPSLLSAGLGPWLGYLSDRHRGSLGRRRPFLLLSIPISTLALGGLALSPRLAGWIAGRPPDTPGAWPVILLAFFWCAFECASVLVAGLFGGLVNDVVPSQMLGRFYGLFRTVSLTAGILFNFYLLKIAAARAPLLLWSFASIYAAGFGLMCWRVREGRYEPVAPEPSHGFTSAFAQYLRRCFGQAYYCWCFLTLVIGTLAVVPLTTFSFLYAQKVGLALNDYGRWTAVQYAASLSLTIPLGWMADRFHPIRVAIGTLGANLVITVLAGCYAETAGSFAIYWTLQGVLVGAYLTGTASLPQKLFPKAHFAQFYVALLGLNGIAALLVLPAIGRLVDFAHQDYRYVFRACAILSVVALLAMLRLHALFRRMSGRLDYRLPSPQP